MPDDVDLMQQVEGARAGDREAMDELFQALIPEVRAYVRLHSGQNIRDRESMTDVVQTICREVFVDLRQFTGTVEKQFRKWLFRLALSKIHDKHRFHSAQKRDVRREVQVAQPTTDSTSHADERLLDCYLTFCTPSQNMSAKEEVARIETAFDQLKDEHRRIITLACFGGLSTVEIAADSGKSEAAVRKLLSRARAHLAVILAQNTD